MAKLMRQYELHDGESRLVAWLDHKHLDVGAKVDLEELPGREWTVAVAYDGLQEKQSLHKPWRVGGIE